MIESICDATSLVVVTICFGIALFRAQRKRNTAWLTLALFFGCMSLGDMYWFGYLAVFGETPQYSYISELSWVASYIFLLMLEVEGDKRRKTTAPTLAAWIPVVVCTACCVYFIIKSGSPLLNIADEGLLAAAGFFAVRGLITRPPDDASAQGLAYSRPFHASVLVFILMEQGVWIASCFLTPGPIETVNPYIALSYVLIVSIAAILACAWRSDDL